METQTPTTVTAEPTITITGEPLALTDTCDRCGYVRDVASTGQVYYSAVSQAYVRVTLPNGQDLVFCGHHYRENQPALATLRGAVITDQTTDINATAGYSA